MAESGPLICYNTPMDTTQSLPADMRQRLIVNRRGQLTPDQRRDLVMQPVVTLLLLLPAILLYGPRFKGLLFAGGGMVGLVLVGLFVGLLMWRSYRFNHARVYATVLQAGKSSRSRWAFWKPLTLYTQTKQPVYFHRRLAPGLRLEPAQDYLVYYLQEADRQILLSLAPADHPDAAQWQPSERVTTR
jgi:hypothetical protein